MPDFDLTAQGFRLFHFFHKPTKNQKSDYLTYDVGEVNGKKLTMRVHLYKNGARSWCFFIYCDSELDLADRVLQHYANECFPKETFNVIFDDISRRAKPSMKVSFGNAFYDYGDHFPDRYSIELMIEYVFLPCWRRAVNRVLAFREPGESWYDAQKKAGDACFRYQGNKLTAQGE